MTEGFEIIREVIHEFIPDSRVILFGSRARSDFYPDSDFDLMIISGEHFTPSEKMNLKTQVRIALLKRGIRSDILINDKAELLIKSKLAGHIIKTIMKEGISL